MKYEEGETFQHKWICLYQQLSSKQDRVSCGCTVTINEQNWDASKKLVFAFLGRRARKASSRSYFGKHGCYCTATYSIGSLCVRGQGVKRDGWRWRLVGVKTSPLLLGRPHRIKTRVAESVRADAREGGTWSGLWTWIKTGRRNWRTISYSLGFGIERVLLIGI